MPSSQKTAIQQQSHVELQITRPHPALSSFRLHEGQDAIQSPPLSAGDASLYAIDFPVDLRSPIVTRTETARFLNGSRWFRSLSDRSIGSDTYEPSIASEDNNKLYTDALPLLEGGNESSDFQKEDECPRVGASLRSAVFNLSTTIIGAGIMALPATMRVLGIPIGLLVLFVMGVLSEVSLEIVARYTDKLRASSFGEMVEGACGRTGRLLAQLAIIINNGGILIVYLIIMGDVLSGSADHTGLFQRWAGRGGWWNNRSAVLSLTMIFVLAPLAFLKKIESLELSSAMSVSLALLFVIISSGIALVKLADGKIATPRMLPEFGSKKDLIDLLIVIPIMTNAFVCQFNVPPIYHELRDRSSAQMYKVGRISITLCVVVYMATAVSGCLLFGKSTASDVLSNFDTDLGIPNSNLLNSIILIGYVIHLMLVFPVIHFSLRQTVDALVFPHAKSLPDSNVRFIIITITLLAIIIVGSTVIPNIWIAFQFTGATTGLALGFIFPALVLLRSQDGSRFERKLAWLILIMSTVVAVVGVSTQIYSASTK